MSRVPRIRFKGFEEDWEQRKLGECFTERIESMPNGELISVTINDGIKKFSELGRHDNSNEDKSKYKKVCIGDIAYNSMRMWQGASGYSPYNGIVSPAYTVLVANEDVNSKCIAYQFKLPRMIHAFQINSQGITSDNWNLKFPTLSGISIYISRSIDEQGKIASLLESLDHLITLHQRKLEKLKIIKKSMLENLFPQNGEKTPKIRFSGFTEDWEQRKLISCLSLLKDGTHGTHKDYPSGPLLLSAKNIKNGRVYYDETDRRISYKDFEKIHRNFKLQIGDILLTIVGSIGETALLKDSFEITFQRSVAFLRAKDNILPEFLMSEFNTGRFRNELEDRKSTSAQPGIYLGDLGEIPVFVSKNPAEQRRVGSYFESLDHLITLHQLEPFQMIFKAIAYRIIDYAKSKP